MDRYGGDVLAGDWRSAGRVASQDVPAERGLVVEDAQTGWVGAVRRVEKAGGQHVVHLEDRAGALRGFPLGPGFLIDGRPVTLTKPVAAAAAALASAREATSRTASGSLAAPNARAVVARASRLFVEGRHDADLLEKIWGDDLRVEGVVVEILDGADDLRALVEDFGPGPGRRMGVLLDHLVPGTKESRIAEEARALTAYQDHLLIVGHPYVDVWQSVKPERLGLNAWPAIPRGTPWKRGVAAHLGWEHATQADLAGAWRRILDRVDGWNDLEPELLGRVEELIDFVTEPACG